jgi:hypothetical protein
MLNLSGSHAEKGVKHLAASQTEQAPGDLVP